MTTQARTAVDLHIDPSQLYRAYDTERTLLTCSEENEERDSANIHINRCCNNKTIRTKSACIDIVKRLAYVWKIHSIDRCQCWLNLCATMMT